MLAKLSTEWRRLIVAYGLLSLASVSVGCWVAAAHRVAPGVWARSLAAWALGLAMAVWIARTAGRRVATGVLLVAVAGLASTFLNPGVFGMHRWAPLGLVQVNVSELLLPGAVVALADLEHRRWPCFIAALLVGMLGTGLLAALASCGQGSSPAP